MLYAHALLRCLMQKTIILPILTHFSEEKSLNLVQKFWSEHCIAYFHFKFTLVAASKCSLFQMLLPLEQSLKVQLQL